MHGWSHWARMWRDRIECLRPVSLQRSMRRLDVCQLAIATLTTPLRCLRRGLQRLVKGILSLSQVFNPRPAVSCWEPALKQECRKSLSRSPVVQECALAAGITGSNRSDGWHHRQQQRSRRASPAAIGLLAGITGSNSMPRRASPAATAPQRASPAATALTAGITGSNRVHVLVSPAAIRATSGYHRQQQR
jgi:hypothetical protein